MASTNFNGYGARPKTIEVPLRDEQVLEVVCDDLPTNPTELTDIFRQEAVNLPYYRMLAVSFVVSRVFFVEKIIDFNEFRSSIMGKTKLNKVLL
jgi:hypothetical protein